MKSFTFGILSSVALLTSGCVSTTNLDTVAADRKQLMIIPESTWKNISNRNFNKFAKQAKSKSVYLEDPRLNRILDKLTPHANQYLIEGREPIDWKISGVLSSRPNAQSFQSGQIVVNTAIYLFENLSDDELATIISHEMAHIIRNHSREKASIAAATNLSILGASMGTGYLVSIASGLSGTKSQSSHSKHLEEEADLIGLDLMVRAGYDHKATLSFWNKFEAKLQHSEKVDKKASLFATHPTTEQRKALLAEQVMNIEMKKAEHNFVASK